MSNLRRSLSSLAALSALAFAQVPDFAPAVSYPSGPAGGAVVAGDFNGDGLTDLATVDNTILGFNICYGAPGGLYTSPVPRSVGSLTGSPVAADLNGDGVTDLAFFASLSLAVSRSLPGGGSGGVEYLASGHATPTHVTAADFNNDGRPDLLVAGSAGFSFLRNLGGGAFALPVMLPQAVSGSYVLPGDFNNDGKLDFVGTAGLTSYSYLGNGDGTFGLPLSTAPIAYGASFADFNSDGKLDIVMMTSQPRQDGSNQAIAVSVGQGNGQFLSQYSYVLNTPFGPPVVGDFTADGKPDVAVYVHSTASLRVFPGNGAFGVMLSQPYSLDAGQLTAGYLLAADLDKNGSRDLVLTSGSLHRIYRNTHGNPPLLAQIKATPAAVVGGAESVSVTVALGGAAPAGGATITLASSDPARAFFPAGNTITIPAGANSATVPVTTSGVASPVSVVLSASWSGNTVDAKLDVVAAYTLVSLTGTPASQYGSFSIPATLTLSGPADAAATVLLNSGNPAVAQVPGSVTVPAGATTVTFPVVISPVTVNTPFSVTASLGGITRTASFTALRPLDTVTVNKAILTQRVSQLKVEATGSNPAATITVHIPATGALLGTLANRGGGKYDGTVIAPPTLTQVMLKSSLGGTTTAPLQIK